MTARNAKRAALRHASMLMALGGAYGCGATPPVEDPPSTEVAPSSPESDYALGQVRQASVSSSWLVATGGSGLNTVTAVSQLGTDSNSNYAVELLAHGARGFRI